MVRVFVYVRTIGRLGAIGSGEEGEKEKDRKRERNAIPLVSMRLATISDGSAFLGANDAFGICPRRTNQQTRWTTRGVRREDGDWRGWSCQGRAGIRR